MFCWHELSKTFDDERCGDIFSALTTMLSYNGLLSLRTLNNLSKNTDLTGSKREHDHNILAFVIVLQRLDQSFLQNEVRDK